MLVMLAGTAALQRRLMLVRRCLINACWIAGAADAREA